MNQHQLIQTQNNAVLYCALQLVRAVFICEL
jgi:hypothetical protein